MDEYGQQDPRVGNILADQQSKSEPKLALEAYEPAYYGVTNRLQATDNPTVILNGKSFFFEVEAMAGRNATVGRVVLMRFGSCTHASDGDQRYVRFHSRRRGLLCRLRCLQMG